jgi:hypothetical protein
MKTLTCEHCESEIDVAKDPRCVVYDPSGGTDVKCAECRKREWERWQASDQESWEPTSC